MKKSMKLFLAMMFVFLGYSSFASANSDVITVNNEPKKIVYAEKQVISGEAKKGTEIEFSLTHPDYKGNLLETDTVIIVGSSGRFIKEFNLKNGKNTIIIKGTYGNEKPKVLEFVVELKSEEDKDNALRKIQNAIKDFLK